MVAKRMPWVKRASTSSPVIDRPVRVRAGEPFELKISFGADAFYVRWISVYYFEDGGEDPQWLGGFRVGDDMSLDPVAGTVARRSKDTFSMQIAVAASGVVRAVVLYEDRGLWEYSKEIDVEEAPVTEPRWDARVEGAQRGTARIDLTAAGLDEEAALG